VSNEQFVVPEWMLTDTVDGDAGEKAFTLALHRAIAHRRAFLENIIVSTDPKKNEITTRR
jgi:hypothetical protein